MTENILKNNKYRFIIFKTFLISIIIFNAFSCKLRGNTESNEKYDIPNMIQSDYRHYIYKNKKKYLVARIKYAEFYEKTNFINCNNINAEIYDSTGDITSIISSDNGKIDKEEGKLFFTGNVVLELLENDAKLYTDELELDYKNNKMISKSKVLFSKEDGSYIKADSMESDIDLEATKFENMEIRYYYEDEDE